MPFKHDADLLFLKYCDDAELKNLADILVYTASGRKRYSSALGRSRMYLMAKKTGCYTAIWKQIATELQLCAGNTLANKLRGGKGVTYRKILKSLCRALDIDIHRRMRTPALEENLTLGIFQRTLLLQTASERKKASADPSLLLSPRRPRWLFLFFFAVLIFALQFQNGFLMQKIFSLPLPVDISGFLNFFTGFAGIFTVLLISFWPLFTMNRRTCLIASVYINALRKTRAMAQDNKRQFEIQQKTGKKGVFSPTFSGGSVNRTARSSASETNQMPYMSSDPVQKVSDGKKSAVRPVFRKTGRQIIVENEYVNS